MTIKELLGLTESLMKDANLTDSYRTAVWIFCDVLECAPAYLIAQEDLSLKRDQVAQIQDMAYRCAAHEPVQYVIGKTEFYGLNLSLTPDVLIPRPETEQLVEVSLEVARKIRLRRILDIGTGSGCIAIAMKQAIPEAIVTACDISESALKIASINAEKNNIKLQLVPADLFSQDFVSVVGGEYDLVIANPPYIPEHEYSSLPQMIRDYEPKTALLCGDAPLTFYQAIIEHMERNLLHHAGILALEVHADYAESVVTLLHQHGVLDVQLKRDLAGLPRFILGEWKRKISLPQTYN